MSTLHTAFLTVSITHIDALAFQHLSYTHFPLICYVTYRQCFFLFWDVTFCLFVCFSVIYEQFRKKYLVCRNLVKSNISDIEA